MVDISKPIIKGGLIAEYIFEDKTKMIIVWDPFKKWVTDHWEEYLSPRAKYLNPDGYDFQYSYLNFYEKAEGLVKNLVQLGRCNEEIARQEIFKLIFSAYKIRFEDKKGIAKEEVEKKIKEKMKKWTWGIDLYAEKVLVGAAFGFYCEDSYLRYPTVVIGRDFNLIKYFIVLIGDKEIIKIANAANGRMIPKDAHELWNKDGLSGKEKKRKIDAIMARIRKQFEPGYKDIDDAWEL